VNVLAIIPARGGSKGLPRKNVLPLAGKPLIAHTIDHARQAACVTRVVVSTDDPEIAKISHETGAEVIGRPPEISGDEATSESALTHVLDSLSEVAGYTPELVVFLQCTSPIRLPDDIDRAVAKLIEAGADSLVSVVRFQPYIWHVADGRAVSSSYDYRARPRRQDKRPEYQENGSIYVFKPWVLCQLGNRLGGKMALYEMDRSTIVDIDAPADFTLCECILSSLQTGSELQ